MKWWWYWLKSNYTLLNYITIFLILIAILLIQISCFKIALCVFLLVVINRILIIIADVYTYKHSKPIKN